jgi:hypothetical protein
MQDGYLSSSQLNVVENTVLQLLAALRPNSVALVDAFDFTDRLLGSVLGRYDGQVYENLYNWALNSPLNKTQVILILSAFFDVAKFGYHDDEIEVYMFQADLKICMLVWN